MTATVFPNEERKHSGMVLHKQSWSGHLSKISDTVLTDMLILYASSVNMNSWNMLNLVLVQTGGTINSNTVLNTSNAGKPVKYSMNFFSVNGRMLSTSISMSFYKQIFLPEGSGLWKHTFTKDSTTFE